MSDFIKVNFEEAVVIARKEHIQLTQCGGRHYCAFLLAEINVIQQIISLGITTESGEEWQNKMRIISENINSLEITREEYDRLCKELGVE